MASIIDEMMCREGEIDPDFEGINQAKAGDMMWCRERGEGEAQFLARCRMEAAAAGYRLMSIAGHVPVSNVTRYCPPGVH